MSVLILQELVLTGRQVLVALLSIPSLFFRGEENWGEERQSQGFPKEYIMTWVCWVQSISHDPDIAFISLSNWWVFTLERKIKTSSSVSAECRKSGGGKWKEENKCYFKLAFLRQWQRVTKWATANMFCKCTSDEATGHFSLKQNSTYLTCCVSVSLLSDSDESPVARERTIIVHANHNQLSLYEEDLSIGGHLHHTRDSGCQTDDFLIACRLCINGKFVISSLRT